MGELPALQESAEGKLKGGFASFSVSMLSTEDGGNTRCSGNSNCTGNTDCHSNTNCFNNTGCDGENNESCTPPSTTTAEPDPTSDNGICKITIFSSLMF